MTVETTASRVQYNTNGTNGPWTVPFPFLQNDYLQVIHTTSDGIDSQLVLDIDYSVAGAGDASGTVTTLASDPTATYPIGGKFTILRYVDALQESDYVDGDPLPAERIEADFDRLSMAAIDARQTLSRALVFPASDSTSGLLPTAALRANKIMAFDSQGAPVVTIPVSGSAADVLLQLASSSNAALGPALVGFGDQNYTGANVGAKLREFRSIRDKGALPGSSDNLNQVNAALADQRYLLAPPGDFAVSADLTNPLGGEFWGPGRLLRPVTSGTELLNVTADKYQHVFGQEYLFAAYNKLRARTPFTLLFAGDSTTAGDSIVDPNALIHTLVRDLVADYGFKITTVNSGVSGINTEQWRTTYLAGQLATNPDAMVIRLGINDPGWNKDGSAGTLNAWEAEKANRRDVSDFATSLRSALTTIRTAKSVDLLSIILMVPNSTSDSANGRDEKWYEAVRLVVRQAARDFECAFIDTYSLIPDSRFAPNRTMDQPAGLAGGPAIHPLDIMNRMIAPYIAELLVPDGLAYTNTSSAAGAPNITTLPQAFPIGYSTWRVTWTINNFVVNGALINFRTADEVSQQIVWPYNVEMRPCVRTSDTAGTNWRDWSSAPPNGLTLSGGWSASGKNLTYEKVNGVVHLSGRIGGGTITAGTVIATLPAGYRPQFDQYFAITCGAGLATVGIISVIAATGAITIVSVSNNTLLDPSGVHFSIY